MEDYLNWSGLGALILGVGGVFAYGAKKYIDLKIKNALAGQAEVIKKHHEKKYNLICTVRGFLEEISHCINHISDGDDEYGEKCVELCMELRQRTRLDIAVIDKEFIVKIKKFTDRAIEYSKSHNNQIIESLSNDISTLDSESWKMMRTISLPSLKMIIHE